jgi:single-strand DNA-binding protein
MYQQIILIGNLGNDPEMRYATSGDPVTSFSLAVSRKWTDSSGEAKEKTTWFRVSVWRNQAEACAKFLTKGRQVMVVGEMEDARVFTGKDGNARSGLEVKATNVKFLGQKGDNSAQADAQEPNATAVTKVQTNDENIPF